MHRRRTVKAATTPPAIAPADTGTWNWGCSEPGNEKMQELGIKINPGQEVHSLKEICLQLKAKMAVLKSWLNLNA